MRRSLLLVLFAAVALNSCASGDEPLDAQTILDRGFSTGMRSADLAIEAELELKGSPSFGDPVRIQATGPYISSKHRLPSADIELEVGTEGNGQTVSTGLLTTGNRAFLKFQDVYYEQPRAQVRRTNRLLRERRGSGGSLSGLGLDPRSWISDAENEGETDVAGVETRHVSGSVDMPRLLRDLNSFLRRSASALGGATGAKTAPLTQAQVSAISDAVDNPSFDVYVGKKDGIIRRVSARIDFDIPKVKRAGLGGIDSGSIRFSVEFTDVNGDQKVEAPADARPLSALTRSLGGGSLLEGLAGDGQAPSPSDPAPQTPVPGADEGAGPGKDDFKAYSACLDDARPEDTEALQRCADLLRP